MKFWKFLRLAAIIASIKTATALPQETAKILPKGVFRSRIIGVFSSPITDRFDSDGQAKGLLNSLNISLSASDLAETNSQLGKLVDTLKILDPTAGDTLLQADLYATASIQSTQTIPVLEYGVSNRMTLGLKIPLVKNNVRASFNAAIQDNISNFQDLASGITPVEVGLNQLSTQLPNTATFAQEIFTKNGYETPSDFNYSGLGDIYFAAKYQLNKSEQHISSVLFGINFPTTSAPRQQKNLLWSGTGDNSTDLELRYYHEYFPNSNLSFVSIASGMLQLSDHEEWSVAPKDFNGSLVDLNNIDLHENLSRNLGDSIWTHLGVNYYFSQRMFAVGSGYEYAFKGKDRYQGSRGLDYASLSEGTDKLSHTIMVSAMLSSIAAYQRKAFVLPGELRFSYYNTFAGRNEVAKQYLRTEIIAFW